MNTINCLERDHGIFRSEPNVLGSTLHMGQHARRPWDLNETMTVGEVVTLYPAAGPVFECLFIDQRFERYDCLDEVAWRHGMESRELLAQLEEELTREQTPEVQTATVELSRRP